MIIRSGTIAAFNKSSTRRLIKRIMCSVALASISTSSHVSAAETYENMIRGSAGVHRTAACGPLLHKRSILLEIGVLHKAPSLTDPEELRRHMNFLYQATFRSELSLAITQSAGKRNEFDSAYQKSPELRGMDEAVVNELYDICWQHMNSQMRDQAFGDEQRLAESATEDRVDEIIAALRAKPQ